VLASGTNAFVINAGVNDTVTIRNVDIEGAPGTGLVGIRFLAGAALHVENVTIRNFRSGNATGIQFLPSGASELYVSNSTITDNGSGAVGGGIVIQPSGAGSAKVAINRVQVENNSRGIVADGASSTQGVLVSVRDSVSAGATNAGILATTPVGGASVLILLDNVLSANNATHGVLVSGAQAIVRIGNSTITGNATGVAAQNSGVLQSFKNNAISGNTSSNGTPITEVPGGPLN
jgi:hypothetical protein